MINFYLLCSPWQYSHLLPSLQVLPSDVPVPSLFCSQLPCLALMVRLLCLMALLPGFLPSALLWSYFVFFFPPLLLISLDSSGFSFYIVISSYAYCCNFSCHAYHTEIPLLERHTNMYFFDELITIEENRTGNSGCQSMLDPDLRNQSPAVISPLPAALAVL